MPNNSAKNSASIKRVLVTGGAGYKGCILVPKLLKKGYEVVVYDLMITYDRGLPEHPKLKVIKGDIRDNKSFRQALNGCDAVIHMACISNDPSFELDPELSKTINYECFEPMVKASKEAGVKRFIYVSSSSVYGVSDAPDVTEEHPLVPLTDYNKYKGLCEPILGKYQSPDFTTVTFRPATVCGYSPRMRFDLSIIFHRIKKFSSAKCLTKISDGILNRPLGLPSEKTEDFVRIYVVRAVVVGFCCFNFYWFFLGEFLFHNFFNKFGKLTNCVVFITRIKDLACQLFCWPLQSLYINIRNVLDMDIWSLLFPAENRNHPALVGMICENVDT